MEEETVRHRLQEHAVVEAHRVTERVNAEAWHHAEPRVLARRRREHRAAARRVHRRRAPRQRERLLAERDAHELDDVAVLDDHSLRACKFRLVDALLVAVARVTRTVRPLRVHHEDAADLKVAWRLIRPLKCAQLLGVEGHDKAVVAAQRTWAPMWRRGDVGLAGVGHSRFTARV